MAKPVGPKVAAGAGTSFSREVTLRWVTWMVAAVIGLAFLFGFGNVWSLALRLGVPPYVAPLVAPAVDLSVLSLLLGTRYLVLNGVPQEHLRPARRLLVFSGVMTLALNVAEPLLEGQLGRAAFDAVGPLLLIGWAGVGPGLLQAIDSAGEGSAKPVEPPGGEGTDGHAPQRPTGSAPLPVTVLRRPDTEGGDTLMEQARKEDAHHWRAEGRPISAETLRKRLGIGAARSRTLVSAIRAEHNAHSQGLSPAGP